MQKSGIMRFGEGQVPPCGQCRGQGAEAHGPQGSIGPGPDGRADEDRRDDADGGHAFAISRRHRRHDAEADQSDDDSQEGSS